MLLSGPCKRRKGKGDGSPGHRSRGGTKFILPSSFFLFFTNTIHLIQISFRKMNQNSRRNLLVFYIRLLTAYKITFLMVLKFHLNYITKSVSNFDRLIFNTISHIMFACLIVSCFY